jgi:DNA processing protein
MSVYRTAEESLKHIQSPFPRDRAIRILERFRGHIVLASDPIFPDTLKRSATCPPMLFALGNLKLLPPKKIAIIGTRDASANGRSIAYRLASNLSKFSPIVSGLASGIDTSAHAGVLRNSERTIAIVPFSLLDIYPKENARLFSEIKEKGLIITEVPPHKPPDQGMFHARNRIVALLPVGIVVIEASLKSGTMDTAMMALDFGTKVMAVPGSPSDPRSGGCNDLIKKGVPLIENYTDVLEVMANSKKQRQPEFRGFSKSPAKSPAFSEEQQQPGLRGLLNNPAAAGNLEVKDMSNKILTMLSVDIPTSLEFIARSINIDMQSLLCQISELEILGKIRKCSTNEVLLQMRPS